MRLLLTSTSLTRPILAGASVVILPLMVMLSTGADAQEVEQSGAQVPQSANASLWPQTGQQSVQQSLFSASSTPPLRSADGIVSNAAPQSAPATTGSIAATRGRVTYPIQPASRALPQQRPVPPFEKQQGKTVRGSRDSDAYDAVGVKAGSFLLYPSLTLFAEGTDNIDNAAVGTKGGIGRVALEVTAQSLWQRHALTLGAMGVFESYQSPNRKPDNELSANADLTLDLADQTKLALGARMERSKEEANNPDLAASGGTASIETAYGLTASLDQGAGPLKLQLRGAFDRERFDEDASRDYRSYKAGGRVGYQVTDQILPFVDVEVARKRYDQRDSSLDGYSLRGAVGVAVTDREKLSGEVSGGVMLWDPDRASLGRDTILFADASVNWSPNALWTLKGGLETSLTSSSTAATSVATRTLSLEADYAVRRNLTLSLDSSISHEDYRGSGRKDWVFDATFGAEYAFNRSVQLIARVGREQRNSNEAGADFSANKIEVGLRLRH
ncbi:outer membrane beta-barrel protein [Cohaesibacter intestini]|uniref:outer membrane beta-barrel protein n=1 Tax=Cohaesibacter intestini TaxID=2211145 RepID=UPI000DE93510|nr:outer membrane beta-barrel protein [Cohaesibacter intestini]